MDQDKILAALTQAIDTPLKRGGIGLLLVVLAVVFFQLMMGANIKQVDKLSDLLNEQKRQLVEKKESAKTQPAYEESLKGWQEKLKAANKSFFTEMEAQEFIDVLPKAVKEEKNVVESIKPFMGAVEKAAGGTLVENRIDLSIKGSYTSLISLLEKFKNYGKVLEVENLRISGGGGNDLSSQFALKFYTAVE